jgi:hypothetical protein
MCSELVPAKLPERFKRGFRAPAPEQLRQRGEITVDWVWRDGEWYFRMDREIVSGRTEAGESAVPPTSANQ